MVYINNKMKKSILKYSIIFNGIFILIPIVISIIFIYRIYSKILKIGFKGFDFNLKTIPVKFTGIVTFPNINNSKVTIRGLGNYWFN